MATLRDLLQAGTGYLRGATSGEQYQREEERRNIEQKAQALHNTIELARARDLMQTSQQMREYRGLQIQDLGDQIPFNRWQRQTTMGEHMDPFATRDFNIDTQVMTDRAMFDVNREQAGIVAGDAQRNLRTAFEPYGGMREAIRVSGATPQVGPFGNVVLQPQRLMSETGQRTEEANARLVEANAAMAEVSSQEAQQLWALRRDDLPELYALENAVNRMGLRAEGAESYVDLLLSEMAADVQDATREKQKQLVINQTLDKFDQYRDYLAEVVNGETPEWVTFDMWPEYKSGELQHERDMTAMETEYGLRTDLAGVPRVSEHTTRTVADPAAIDATNRQTAVREYEAMTDRYKAMKADPDIQAADPSANEMLLLAEVVLNAKDPTRAMRAFEKLQELRARSPVSDDEFMQRLDKFIRFQQQYQDAAESGGAVPLPGGRTSGMQQAE